MPWNTPTLRQVRSLVRDSVNANLPGADANVANSVLRVVSDSQGALCHLTLQYIDWLALQLLPDTAETEWLDRHGFIWLVNSDGSKGRKQATLASGSILLLGTPNGVVPIYTQLTYGTGLTYETLQQVILDQGGAAVSVPARALTPGTIGNLDPGTQLATANPLIAEATVEEMIGGTDTETDDELRARVLWRIRQPPMGGDEADYVAWALAVPGVTRAWCYPQEMGIGTCTVRFMMDDLRAGNGGFPLPDDVDAVANYINTVRPVTVKDMFVEAPVPYPIDVRISYLDLDVRATHDAIQASLLREFFVRAAPGQVWFRAWTDEAIMSSPGVNAYDVVGVDQPMPNNGYMAVLGDLTYGQ